MSEALTLADLDRAQKLAQTLLSKAVNDEHGRDESDPFYKVVTENRDGPTPKLRAKYSSCADLAHWMLRCLGVRADWLNRNDDGDAHPWRNGVNLNWLCPPPIGKCALAHSKLVADPAPGDVFVESNQFGGHVFCVIAYDAEADMLTTAEYGQPGGKRKRRGGFKAAFARHPLSHLRLVDVLASGAVTEPPDYAIVEDWDTGEEIDEIEDTLVVEATEPQNESEEAAS
jgi:hypothetical protein